MKLINKKSLTLLFALTPYLAFAEQDSFDMSLSGSFDKQYCTINLITNTDSFTKSFPISEEKPRITTNPLDNNTDYHFAGGHLYKVTCASTYPLRVAVNSPDAYPAVVDTAKYAPHVKIHTDNIEQSSFLAASNSVEITTLTHSPTVNVAVNGLIAPVSGDFNELPDSFTYTFPFIITIEETN